MLVDSDIPEHHNNRDKDIEDWEEAKQFITDLRSQMKRIDSNLDEYINDASRRPRGTLSTIIDTSGEEISTLNQSECIATDSCGFPRTKTCLRK